MIREAYKKIGVKNYYQNHAHTYHNPHKLQIHKHLDHLIQNYQLGLCLDLCCGDGLVTSYLAEHQITADGTDPYMHGIYKEKTGRPVYPYDFKQLAEGTNLKYDTIICSFALHLCPISLLPNLLYSLAMVAPKLIVITPHKKPNIVSPFWVHQNTILCDRVRSLVYHT